MSDQQQHDQPRPPCGRRRMGAVERLGRASGPTPTAALQASALNKSGAPTRRGAFYERAKSRQSRHKTALMENGTLSRDQAVPLGKPKRVLNNSNKPKKVFQESLDSQMDALGQQRSREITMNNMKTKTAANKRPVHATSSAAMVSSRAANANQKRPFIKKVVPQPLQAPRAPQRARVQPQISSNRPAATKKGALHRSVSNHEKAQSLQSIVKKDKKNAAMATTKTQQSTRAASSSNNKNNNRCGLKKEPPEIISLLSDDDDDEENEVPTKKRSAPPNDNPSQNKKQKQSYNNLPPTRRRG